jgi:hypothetical protein
MKILYVCSLCLLLSGAVAADPTRPAPGWQAANDTKTATAVPTPRLQLIKQTASGRVALIDGDLVRQGDRYKQYLVTQILAAQVVLELNGEQLVLPLLNTAIKQYEK